VLPKSSSLEDLDAAQIQRALGLREDAVLSDYIPLDDTDDAILEESV
jgi:hypothetical protein